MSKVTIQYVNLTPLIYITDGYTFTKDSAQIVMGKDMSVAFNKKEAKEIAAWLRANWKEPGRKSHIYGFISDVQIKFVNKEFIHWGGLILPRWACYNLPDALESFAAGETFSGNYSVPSAVSYISRGGIGEGIGLFAVYQKDPLEIYLENKQKSEQAGKRIIDNSSFRLEAGDGLFVISHIRTFGVKMLWTLLDVINYAAIDSEPMISKYDDHIVFAAIEQIGQPYWQDHMGIRVQVSPIEPKKTIALMHNDGRRPGRIILNKDEVPSIVNTIERAIEFFND